MADDTGATTGERLVVGLVRGVHGLRGAVRVEILTDHPEARFAPGVVLAREGSDIPLTIAAAEPIKDGPGWRVRFTEITTRDGADGLRSAYLETITPIGAGLGRGEVYWHEVIGVEVHDLDGTVLGQVEDVYRVAQNEVYVVSGGPYGSFDLPAVRAFIRIFAPRRGEIVVDREALGLEASRRQDPTTQRPKAPRRTSPKRRSRTAGSTPATTDATDPTGDDPTGDTTLASGPASDG